MNRLILVLAVAGCAATPLPLPPPAPPGPPPVAVADPKPVAAAVTRDYRAAAQKEVAVVTSPAATPESVRAIHQADLAARHAVTAVQGPRPAPDALTRAKEAVKALKDTLNTTP